VPILCGGESDAALRRAASVCDGWVGSAYKWDVGVSFVEKLTALRHEYGRQNQPFEIMFALLEQPTPDLYKRAEDIGITALMWNPWAGLADGDRDAGKPNTDRYRAAIERFGEEIIAKWR
jgi:alkanesulfonate monooxygenase SsuD/methylene tetrahydromethanopterin reductase-like flavin-dependent oxidoreductase (luciferase family)